MLGKKFTALSFALFLLAPSAWSSSRISTAEYVSTYKEMAIENMRRTGIPASITLAQGILESGSGNSKLAKEGNNHFGIKCHKSWTGESMRYDDDLEQECFRVYSSPLESFLDHSEFLTKRGRYSFLFELDPLDYKAWAHGLKKAGYATAPDYAWVLIRLIKKYELNKFDSEGSPLLAAKRKAEEDEKAGIGVIQINGINTVILGNGQDLTDVSKNTGIPVKRLKRYNEVSNHMSLGAGQNVFLQPKRKRNSKVKHVVTDNENMYMISQRYGVKIETIYKRNKMDVGTEPEVGEYIQLYGRRQKPPKLRKDTRKRTIKKIAEAKKKFKYHVVGDEDTLYSISRLHGLTVDSLKELNRLDSNLIKPGDRLIVGVQADK